MCCMQCAGNPPFGERALSISAACLNSVNCFGLKSWRERERDKRDSKVWHDNKWANKLINIMSWEVCIKRFIRRNITIPLLLWQRCPSVCKRCALHRNEKRSSDETWPRDRQWVGTLHAGHDVTSYFQSASADQLAPSLGSQGGCSGSKVLQSSMSIQNFFAILIRYSYL